MDLPDKPSTSARSLEADLFAYNFVKRKKPRLLLEMFGKERCEELEKLGQCFDQQALVLQAAKRWFPVKDAAEDPKGVEKTTTLTFKEVGPPLGNNDPIPRTTVRITPDLAVFNYFHERKQGEALKLLFDAKKREGYGRKIDEMGIWMPPVRRIYAHYRYVQLAKKVKDTAEIWECLLCKKQFKAKGCQVLNHIGTHEDIPCPCVIEGCEQSFKTPSSLRPHILRKHMLPAEHLNSQQYHQLTQTEHKFHEKAAEFRQKYFPPESFIGFNDCKRQNAARDLEDPKCKQCGRVTNDYSTRRRHIAEHLSIAYDCVFEGCRARGNPLYLGKHFREKHVKTIKDLSEEQLFKFKRMKVDFGKLVTKVLPDYFPYKLDSGDQDDGVPG